MRTFLFILLIFIGAQAIGQNESLAKNYFQQGEYEKALIIFKKLYKKTPSRTDHLMALIETHQQLENFTEAETLLKDRLNSPRAQPQLNVDLGYNYSLQSNMEEANRYYNLAIETAIKSPNYAYIVGRTFENYSLLDQAVTIYERAMEGESNRDYNMQLARIYGEQGKLDKMFGKYVNLIEINPSGKSIAQRNFSLFISDDPQNEANIILRKILLQNLQRNQNVLYNELLSWLFIQQKEFKKAFTQEKAIYKRTEEDLRGIGDLALITIAEEDYENATEIVNFLIDKSTTPEAKLQGNQYLMKIALATTTPKDYSKIEKQFEDLLDEFGRESSTYLLQIDYNHFLAFLVGKKDVAVANLQSLSKQKLTSYQEARVKMELADILVFDEKFNQALIYYSQIQKKVHSDVLAQEARFKVARTSYFKGDFEWAQIQLDVLRKSASQLIANDAMQLSLMIRDNSLEDSTQTALKKYARADLMAFQLKKKEAISALDEIIFNHKGEKIEDEALLKQGELYESTGQFAKAEANYLKLIQFYKEDILADDAHYRLAKLYQNELQQEEKAKEFYEQIIFDFKDSIFFVEARKQYRSLRGDAIN